MLSTLTPASSGTPWLSTTCRTLPRGSMSTVKDMPERSGNMSSIPGIGSPIVVLAESTAPRTRMTSSSALRTV